MDDYNTVLYTIINIKCGNNTILRFAHHSLRSLFASLITRFAPSYNRMSSGLIRVANVRMATFEQTVYLNREQIFI